MHRLNAMFAFVPLDVYLILTNECNLACCYCIRKPVKHLPQHMAIRLVCCIINSLKGLTIRRVILTGGEPLMHPQLISIVSTFQHRYPIVICTNGWILSDRIEELIKNSSKRISFQISIDAPQERHDRIVGRSGAFCRALKSIECANCHGVKPIVATTVGKENWRSILELFKQIRRFKISTWRISAEMPCPHGNDVDSLLSGEIWNKLVNRLRKLSDLKGIEKIEARSMFAFATEDVTPKLSPFANILAGCGAAKTRVYFRTDGSISLCPLLDDYAIYPPQENFSNWWTETNALDDFRFFPVDKLKECTECKWKEICKGGCHGTALNLTGTPFHVDPRCCHIKDVHVI